MKKNIKKFGQAEAVVFNPIKQPIKLVLAPGGSLCPIEDLRNPNS